ncbi:MAG: LCP family protein [Dethiobacteria bacterium]|jgi:LCP family protein required for cell wall assembly
MVGGRKKTGKSRKKNIFIYVVLILTVLSVATGLWLKLLWDEIYQVALPENTTFPAKEEKSKDDLKDVMNVLLLGLDSREKVMRSDTIMLLILNRKTNELNIISIPRDMRVEIPGHGMDKINHAHAYGGVALTRQAVENLLGINIDYYMTTGFDGFENIVDILGGVEIDVEEKMRYYGVDVTIKIDPGLQVMDGKKALEYVRWRGYPDEDIGRVKRQQQFLKALIQEMVTFKNVLAFPSLLPELAQNIKTDLELNQALKLANKLRNVDIEEINTFTLPGKPGDLNGISYVFPLEDEIRQLMDRCVRGIDSRQS